MKTIYIENDDYKAIIVSGLERKDLFEILSNLKGIVQCDVPAGELTIPVYSREDIYTILWVLTVRHLQSETRSDGGGGFIFTYE